MKTSAPPPPPRPSLLVGLSVNYTFSGALPHVLGLRSERFLKVRGRGDFAQSGASGRGPAQRRGGQNEGGRRRPRNTSAGLAARGVRPPHCLPAGQESFPHSGQRPQLMLLIASLGPQRKAARPGRLKSAHCSLRGQQQQPPPPRRPEAGAGLQARGRVGSAQAQDELAGWGAGGKTGAVWGSAARGCPLLEVGRRGTAVSTSPPACAAGRGLANPTREASQALCFSRSDQGQGNPVCLSVGMDYWKTRRKVPCTSACTVLFWSQQTVN